MVLNRLDLAVVGTALVSFLFFLVLHVIVIRRRPDSSAFQALVASCALFATLDAGAWLWLMIAGGQPLADYPATDIAVAGVASLALYGLLSFDYVIGWFNLGETARRIRLLRELARAPGQRMTADELLRVYNADMIVTARLGRLVSSGQLRVDGDRYRLGGRVFLGQAQLLVLLKSLIPPPAAKH
jgi:hypothetical protein